MEYEHGVKNIYFVNRNLYQGVYDFDGDQLVEFLLGEYNEYKLAERRLAANLEKSQDREWILKNFEKYYSYHDMRLTAMIALALERQIMVKLDRGSLLNLLKHNPFCRNEIDEWIEDFIFDLWSDMSIDISWENFNANKSSFRRKYKYVKKAGIDSLQNVLEDIFYVEFTLFFKQRGKRNKKKKDRKEKVKTYIRWKEDGIRKFTIGGATGTLVSEWSPDSFLYIQ